MGKGDKKSRRGKISMGTFGVRRLKKNKPVNKPAVAPKEVKEPDAVKPVKAARATTPKTEPKAKKTQKAPSAAKKS